jgi:hypothetical protein
MVAREKMAAIAQIATERAGDVAAVLPLNAPEQDAMLSSRSSFFMSRFLFPNPG